MKTAGIFLSLTVLCLTVFSCPESATGPTTVFSDNFSGYGGFPAPPWASLEAPPLAWTISGGAAHFANAAHGVSCVVYTGWNAAGDCSVSCDLRKSGATNGTMALLIRASGTMGTFTGYGFCIVTASSQYYLLKDVNGSGIFLSGPYALPSGFDYSVYHTYKLTISGSTLRGYIDGVQRCMATDAGTPLGAGTQGVTFAQVDECYLDNFLLTTP
jgi:hypothetical protein